MSTPSSVYFDSVMSGGTVEIFDAPDGAGNLIVSASWPATVKIERDLTGYRVRMLAADGTLIVTSDTWGHVPAGTALRFDGPTMRVDGLAPPPVLYPTAPLPSKPAPSHPWRTFGKPEAPRVVVERPRLRAPRQRILAAYDSACPVCNGEIKRGDPILWTRGKSGIHVGCGARSVATLPSATVS